MKSKLRIIINLIVRKSYHERKDNQDHQGHIYRRPCNDSDSNMPGDLLLERQMAEC